MFFDYEHRYKMCRHSLTDKAIIEHLAKVHPDFGRLQQTTVSNWRKKQTYEHILLSEETAKEEAAKKVRCDVDVTIMI